MRLRYIAKLAFLVLAMLMASCKTQTNVQKATGSHTTTNNNVSDLVGKVAGNAQTAQFITSKIKFKIDLGDKDISLGGKLYMKRDDVIRIQLTALGLFEAGRLELTKDYVLVVDRMNKQYIKVDYSNADFLRQSGLNFYSLQALFWNELFLPSHTARVSATDAKNFTIDTSQFGALVLSHENGNLHYNWTASSNDYLINKFSGKYSASGANVGVYWTYSDFKLFASKMFPTTNNVKITTPKKTVTMDIELNSPNNDSDWETRTNVSNKYKQVSLDDIMKKLSSL